MRRPDRERARMPCKLNVRYLIYQINYMKILREKMLPSMFGHTMFFLMHIKKLYERGINVYRESLELMVNQWQQAWRKIAQWNRPVIIEIHLILFPMHWHSTQFFFKGRDAFTYLINEWCVIVKEQNAMTRKGFGNFTSICALNSRFVSINNFIQPACPPSVPHQLNCHSRG